MRHSLCFSVSLLATCFAFLPGLWSQTGVPGGTSGGSSGGGTASPTNPGTGRTNRPGNYPDQPENPLAEIPIYISGKVASSDGSPPPVSISIQRVCMGNPRTVAYTDSKGRFSFQWGDTTGVLPDASDAIGTPGIPGRNTNSYPDQMGGLRNTRGALGNPLQGCELRAYAPGFSSDAVNLSARRPLDNPDVGIIVLRRLANVEGTSISATSLNAPKEARKAFEKGLQLSHKARIQDAAKEFESAVAAYPQYATAWLELGRARVRNKQEDSAREAFSKAMDADPKLVEPWIELGLLASRAQNWKAASEYLDRALKLDPVDFPQVWYVNAVANFNTGNYEVAEKSAREALRNDSQHRNPRAEQLLGFILVKRQDYGGATDALRNYIRLAPNASDLDQVKAQLAEIEARQTPRQQ